MQKVILASQSPKRLELLNILGIKDIEVVPANIDESEMKGEKPNQIALRLSKEKATKILALYNSGEFIIAADTVAWCKGKTLPKALTDDDVRYCLKRISGGRHKLYTGITITKAGTNETRSKVVETIVKVKRFSEQEIEEYVTCKEGLNKAGGYSIAQRFQSYVPSISGQISNVIGLPLYETKNMLLSLGYKFEV